VFFDPIKGIQVSMESNVFKIFRSANFLDLVLPSLGGVSYSTFLNVFLKYEVCKLCSYQRNVIMKHRVRVGYSYWKIDHREKKILKIKIKIC